MIKPLVVLASVVLLSAGCSSVGGPSGGMRAEGVRAVPGLPTSATPNPVSQHIQHIVVVVQENRTFENFFAGYPGANAPMVGCGKPLGLEPLRPRHLTQTCPPSDIQIPLHPISFKGGPNFAHSFEASIVDWDNGNMDGFSLWGGKTNHHAAYAYVEQQQVAPYWTMAQQYVLADEMFPTEFGPSWTGHITLVAGTDNLDNNDDLALADFTSGPSDSCTAPPGTTTTTVDATRAIHKGGGPFPCFDQFNTMAQSLDAAGVSWKFYVTQNLKSSIWSPFAAIKYVREGPDWGKNFVTRQTQILTDPRHGKLASVSWVVPDLANSDHPEYHSDTGPSWVTSVVNAIGTSGYWGSTAIIVIWDDFGGFYDNAPPPQPDFRGLGIRVPCIIISPYAKHGYVSHTTYEFGSILKFIEEAFPAVQPLGLTSQGYTDTRAQSLDDSFDFTQPVRAFRPISSKYPASYFLHQPRQDDFTNTD
ncbi:MAG TPA: alkaline phosphatase family protein [Candidatus Cybelea sp.]|jgi:phospholipase C|nr:alkaline phosphatase family protein [Candidatus Cybelea sp.]